MPNSDPQVTFQEPYAKVFRHPSLLREQIPILDESISAVRRAAALPTTAPTLITTPSRERESLPNSIFGTSGAFSNVSSDARNEQTSNQTRTYPTRQPFAPAANTRAEPSSSPLDMRDLQATFSEVFSVETPFQTSNANSDANPERSTLSLHYQHIGLLGETFINDWLSRELPNDWNPLLHWTSRNRNVVYPGTPFRSSERDYTDFTYTDTRGDLSRLLSRYGSIQDVRHWLTNPPTYHLEVKSTTATCNEPFFMGNNQIEKARDFSFSFEENMVPENVYVVIRLCNLERQTAPGFAVCVDPWGMYLRLQLNLVARSDYAVTLQI
ncbi:hypothetical protein BDZ45DRAFT_752834 [Acephala macrosclerotiorum]|nr:hypothetical protein BDZ45DRAFT_752834 [Acephala macrosclerotiorum]